MRRVSASTAPASSLPSTPAVYLCLTSDLRCHTSHTPWFSTTFKINTKGTWRLFQLSNATASITSCAEKQGSRCQRQHLLPPQEIPQDCFRTGFTAPTETPGDSRCCGVKRIKFPVTQDDEILVVTQTTQSSTALNRRVTRNDTEPDTFLRLE